MNSRIFTYFEIIVFKGAVKKGKREFNYFKKAVFLLAVLLFTTPLTCRVGNIAVLKSNQISTP